MSSRCRRRGWSIGRWLDEAGRPTELVVHEDGSVFSRVDPSAWERVPLTVRVLTPAGVEIVASAVADGIEGSSGCATVRTPDARPHTVVARTDVDLAGFVWGEPYEPPLLAADEADQRLVTGLGARIEDLSAWLPPDAWVDPEARPYVGQWLVDVMQRHRSPDSQEPVGPDPTRLETLASPRYFASFGLPVIGTPDGPPTAATAIAPERCQVSDAERAAEIGDELRRTGALAPTTTQPGWRYTVPGPPSYDVIVQLVALRPGEFSCLDYSKASEDAPPAPPPTSSVVETPRTDLTIVCWWLDVAWPRPPTPRTLWHDACRR